MAESNIKGACIKSVIDSLQRADSFEPILAALAPAHRELFAGLIVTSGWYPAEAYLALLDQVVVHHHDTDLAFCYQLGQRIIRDGLGSIYKRLLRLASTPSGTIKRAPLLWGMYFQGSALEILEVHKHGGKVAVEDVGRTTRPYCATQMGGMDEAIASSGGKHQRILHTQCRLDGFSRCLFELSWEE